jgi:hypothetical protein
MEFYLFRSFRPQKGPFPRLVPSQLFTIPREIPSLPSFPVRVAEYSIQSNDENMFAKSGLIAIGTRLNTGAAIDECTKILTVERASSTLSEDKSQVIHKIRYEHPVHGVVIDVKIGPCQMWSFGSIDKMISDGIPRRAVKLDSDIRTKWVSRIAVPFTLTETPDKTFHFEDCRGKGIVVGRHETNKGGDYSFYICENEEERLSLLLCSCFLRIAYPALDPEVAKKRKERRKLAIIKNAEQRSKDPKWKASRRGHQVQKKAIDLCDDITGFKLNTHKFIIENLKNMFSFLLYNTLLANFNYGRPQTGPRFKLYLKLFDEFYATFCGPLHPVFSQQSQEILDKMQSALKSEEFLASYRQFVTSKTEVEMRALITTLTADMHLSFAAVPAFTDLATMPQAWREKIEELKLFDFAMKIRHMQDKLANVDDGLFWRFNSSNGLYELISQTLGAMLAEREKKKVKFTGRGFEHYPANIPWGVNFPKKLTTLIPPGPYLIGIKDVYLKTGQVYVETKVPGYTGNTSNALHVLSNQYFCSMNRHYSQEICVFKNEQGNSLRQVKIRESFCAHVDPASIQSTLFAIYTNNFTSTVPQNVVKIFCIDVEYLFSKERAATVKASPYKNRRDIPDSVTTSDPLVASTFNYEFADSDQETHDRLKKIRQSYFRYILSAAGKYLFLLIAAPFFPLQTDCTNQIVLLEWDAKNKKLQLIVSHKTTGELDSNSQRQNNSKPLMGKAFTFSSKPHLLYQPYSQTIDISLWTLHRKKLQKIQQISSLPGIKRLMPADKVDNISHYSLSLTRIDNKLFLCTECRQTQIVNTTDRTPAQPLYTMCRLKLT